MWRPLILALALSACVPEKKTDEYKTSELVPHFSRTPSGISVICDAYFSHKDAPTTPVTLEESAFMTCNGTVLVRSGPYFSGVTNYTPGVMVQMSLIRQIDGSTLSDTQKID